MRTTITLPDAMVKHALAVTGEKRLSQAITKLLDEDYRRRQRMALIDYLTDNPVPHDYAKIKAQRKGRR